MNLYDITVASSTEHRTSTDIPDMLFLGSYLSCLLEESVTATINFSRRSVWTAFHELCIVFLSINDWAFLKFIEERTNLRCVY